MDTSTRNTMLVGLAALIALTAVAVPNVLEALNRKRQKVTMAAMRAAATKFEAGQPFVPMRDDWGHPMRIRARGRHYSIRAAGRDGEFEQDVPLKRIRTTTGFDADIVFLDGNFVQMPEGI